jgi:putative addiction module component (TIGR02574 family)
MSEVMTRILEQIDALPNNERAAIAHAVLLSLEPEDPDAEAEWDAELVARAESIRNGEAVGIPAEQGIAELRKRLS